MSIQGSSNFSIEGGVSLAITGDQHNYYVGRDLVHISDPSIERSSTALDQYRELKTGNIRLKRKIAESTVMRTDRRGFIKETFDARRIVHVATIHGEDKGEEFLYVQYTGPDADQAYQQDFKTFSAVKDVISLELFGYINWNAMPALVFYDALIPVSHVFEQNGYLAMLYTYFSCRASVQGLDEWTPLRELWVEPRTGNLRKGPYVHGSFAVRYQVWSKMTLALPGDMHPLLDLRAYSNTSALFQYLIGVLPARTILEGISWSNRFTREWPNNQEIKFILSFLPGTVYHRTSREIIARYPVERDKWFYYPWERHFNVPDVMRENTLVMEDGSVRFLLKPSDIESLESFELLYDVWPMGVWDSFVELWVLQSHAIFSQLEIPEGQWEQYFIMDDFRLHFKREQDKEASHICTDFIPASTLIYLFIRPGPRPCDDGDKWDAWLEGTHYYWSFDSSGNKEISEDDRMRLGLPSFKTAIAVWHDWWGWDAYDALQMLHSHENFDPASLGLARSLGCTILEVVGSDARFEEVKDNHGETMDIDADVESARLYTFPSVFNERIQWIRAHQSLFSGRMRALSTDEPLCSNVPNAPDVD